MYSDVNSRYPDFKDFTRIMRREIADGGLYGINDDVYDMITNCVPVGLDQGGEVVLPDGYLTTDGPAVLMVQPDDKRLFWRNALAQHVEANGYETEVLSKDDSYFEVALAAGDCAAFVIIEDVLDATAEGFDIRFVPTIMAIETWYTNPQMGLRVFAHESDHWKMANGFATPVEEFNAFSYYCDTEKSAFGTELQVVLNQFGEKPIISTMKRALGYLERLPFNDAVDGLEYLMGPLSDAGKSLSPVLAAIALKFGDGSDRTTPDEQSYYSALEVVNLYPLDAE